MNTEKKSFNFNEQMNLGLLKNKSFLLNFDIDFNNTQILELSLNTLYYILGFTIGSRNDKSEMYYICSSVLERSLNEMGVDCKIE